MVDKRYVHFAWPQGAKTILQKLLLQLVMVADRDKEEKCKEQLGNKKDT